jgi:hypothetical protein
VPRNRKDPPAGRSFAVPTSPRRKSRRRLVIGLIVGGLIFAVCCSQATDWALGIITSATVTLVVSRPARRGRRASRPRPDDGFGPDRSVNPNGPGPDPPDSTGPESPARA